MVLKNSAALLVEGWKKNTVVISPMVSIRQPVMPHRSSNQTE